MRSEDARHPIPGRLDHALPAAAAVEAAAGEPDVGQPPRRPQLADRVEQHDGGHLGERPGDPRPAGERQPGPLDEPGDLLEPVGVPGDEDQPQVSEPLAQPGEHGQDGGLLRRVGAAGEPDERRGRAGGISPPRKRRRTRPARR